MFEKEAEEYAEKYADEYNMAIEDFSPKSPRQIVLDAFKDGAEFGYNKANEWHYVKDGIFPIECVSCLLYLSDNVNPITGWRHRGVWYFADNRDLEKWQDKVIAWKEIVLPELMFFDKFF